MLDWANSVEYDTLFMKGKPEALEAKKTAKDDKAAKKAKKEKRIKEKNFDDELEKPNVTDDQILHGILDHKK